MDTNNLPDFNSMFNPQILYDFLFEYKLKVEEQSKRIEELEKKIESMENESRS